MNPIELIKSFLRIRKTVRLFKKLEKTERKTALIWIIEELKIDITNLKKSEV